MEKLLIDVRTAKIIMDVLKEKYENAKVFNDPITKFCIRSDVEIILHSLQGIDKLTKKQCKAIMDSIDIKICPNHFEIFIGGFSYYIDRIPSTNPTEIPKMSVKNHPNFHAVQFATDVVKSYVKSLRGHTIKDADIPTNLVLLFVSEIEDYVDDQIKNSKSTTNNGN